MDTTWPSPLSSPRMAARASSPAAASNTPPLDPAMLVAFLMLEPGQLIMELKMLTEVKKRAEKPAPVPR